MTKKIEAIIDTCTECRHCRCMKQMNTSGVFYALICTYPESDDGIKRKENGAILCLMTIKPT